MALGVQRAVMSAGKDVKVIGLDGITDALHSVAAGELVATVSWYPSGASHGIFLSPYVELNRHFHNETLETGR